MSNPRTRVGYHNIKVTLEDRPAQRALRLMLAEDPDILGLGEFGSNRNDILRSHGKLIVGSGSFEKVKPTHSKGMIWLRGGRGPVTGLASDRFEPTEIKTVLMARGRDVRNQAGTKGVEEDKVGLIIHALDKATGRETAILNFHLVAHVQGPKGYRFPDDPRKDMHVEGRQFMSDWFREQLRNGVVPYMVGDTNWHKLDVPPACATHDKRVVATFNKRDIDSIYARRKPRDTYEVNTPSDHDGRVAVFG